MLPTGSGKSHIIAEFCKDVIQNWPDQRILILTHVKELIEQDVEKILMAWPTAPLGIYSASIGSKRLGEPITVAGIQSIRKHAAKVGHIDIVIVDEAHLISTQGRRRVSDIPERPPDDQSRASGDRPDGDSVQDSGMG